MKLCELDANDPWKGAALGFCEHGIEFSRFTKEAIVGRDIPVGTVTHYGLDTHINAEVKEGVELYLCFPSGPSWPVVGWSLPLQKKWSVE